MKSVNGNNKLERQINKAKKYMDIVLEESSNKYLIIRDFDKTNTFIVVNAARRVKCGELTVIEPANSQGKVIFKPTWATLKINNFKTGYNELTIFQEKDPEKINWLKELCFGADDIYTLENYMNTVKSNIEIEKA